MRECKKYLGKSGTNHIVSLPLAIACKCHLRYLPHVLTGFKTVD